MQKVSEDKKDKNKRSPFVTILIILILLAGVALILYPSFSDWLNKLNQSRVIVEYDNLVSENSYEENERLYRQAVSYNEKISKKGIDLSLINRDSSDPEKDEYLNTLNITKTGIMGYITIPSVSINLPIYHDTADPVLQVAVGHMAGSSLPVGGESTHAVLTAHTGLPQAKLFTDIDKLKEGDTFYITVLDHLLTYEVDSISVVLPKQLEDLKIEEGKDLVTLVTCTPYGINTHRLLVTGERIPNPENKIESGKEYVWSLTWHMLIVLLIIAGVVFFIIFIWRKRKNKDKSDV